MCGRFFIEEESPEFFSIVEAVNRSPLTSKWLATTGITTSGEIRPTNVVPVIASSKGGKQTIYPMKWGFTSEIANRPLLINARVETAPVKPTFKEAWQSHRCIVPASYYFEWEHRLGADGKKHTGDKFMIQPKGAAVTWLCGLYRIENGLPTFVILTKAPSAEISFIHDRMPLILPQNYVSEWIKPENSPAELLKEAETDMIYERVV